MDNSGESIEHVVPELPHLITFITQYFHGESWAEWLHDWDSIFFSILIAGIISLIFRLGIKNPKMIPSGLQSFLELGVGKLREVVVGVLGSEGDKYLPLLGTLFIYIFCMNVAGMVPFMKSPSTNLSITSALALYVFGLVQYLNIRNMGFFGFIYHMAGSPKTFTEWLIVPLMLPIELLVQISRPITLALRLFGNILGEDILIATFAIFGIVLVAHYGSPIGLPLQLPVMFFGLLTSLMQALVFTLLSAVYIMLSMPHHEESHS